MAWTTVRPGRAAKMSAARGVSEAVEDVVAIFARVIEVGAIRAVNVEEGRRVRIEGGRGIEGVKGSVVGGSGGRDRTVRVGGEEVWRRWWWEEIGTRSDGELKDGDDGAVGGAGDGKLDEAVRRWVRRDCIAEDRGRSGKFDSLSISQLQLDTSQGRAEPLRSWEDLRLRDVSTYRTVRTRLGRFGATLALSTRCSISLKE